MKAILVGVKVLALLSKKSQDGTKTYINLDVYSEGTIVKVSLQPEDIAKAPKIDSVVNLEVLVKEYKGEIKGFSFVGIKA